MALCQDFHFLQARPALKEASISLPIHVEAYSGYKANERPRSFSLDPAIGENGVAGVYDIDAVEDRWYDPNAEYFKVRTSEGKRYLLRCDSESGQWALQSGFGAELLARPGIEIITVDATTIRRAEDKISGCERCRADEADHPFAFILGDVLGKRGAFDFLMSEPASCPNCRSELSEKTLVEPHGGIEVSTR